MGRPDASLTRSLLLAAVSPLAAQARRSTAPTATEAVAVTTPVLRLSTTSIAQTGPERVSARVVPPLTTQDKLNLAMAASIVVSEVETPVRITASATRVPNRASVELFSARLVTSTNPGDEGLIELPLNTAMQLTLWFPQGGQPHLLDCLGAAREPGISLTLVMQAGDYAPKTQLIIPPGWQHITSLLIPEKPGAYTVKLWPHNTLDVKYCEITPLK